MNVLIADDHELVRDTIRLFLEQDSAILVSVAGDLPGAIAAIGRDGPFDLVVLDYDMPGMHGLAGLTEAMTRNQGKPVAIISGSASRPIADAVLAAGAAGFLPKSMSAKSLVHAVRFMAAGEVYVPFAYLAKASVPDVDPRAAALSQREVEVAKGLIDGRSNKEIARDLNLQEVTIKLHVKTLCRKLEARNRTHAAMIGRDVGLA
jgi:DNA-binding NarL/FixJ family response regulator